MRTAPSFVIVLLIAAFATEARTQTEQPLPCGTTCGCVNDCVARDYPLYESPNYRHGGSHVEYRVLSSKNISIRILVLLEFLEVKMRTDGLPHTSLQCHGMNDAKGECKKASMLVPVAEDVAVWQAEIERWRDIRKRYLDSLPKPRRVLPWPR